MAGLGLWCTVARAQEGTCDFNSAQANLTYPYPPFEGQPLAYASSLASGASLAQWGMSDADQAYVLPWKWMRLPPLDNEVFGLRLYDGQIITNVFNSAGTKTQLLWEDPFWPPACARMTAELARLQGTAHVRKTMGVTVKHHGVSFPDEQNVNATVYAYISVFVANHGPETLSTFTQGCASWFAGLVADGLETRASRVDTNRQHVLDTNGSALLDAQGRMVTDAPPLLGATVGGGRSVRTANGTFMLWVEPVAVPASD
ncbi:MAG: hypothetical protein M1838_000560 [Thelocarpon superellum]|nr:MAG: hypothetical protein M1838_000560 [Thelocarpon superellum]